MIFHKFLFVGMFFVTISVLGALIDFEEFRQDFVIETKRIILKEYPDAFNPSIIRWKDKFLMSFRVILDPKNCFVSHIGLVWLDEHLNPTSKPILLDLRQEHKDIPSRAEDGRLIVVKDRLLLIYSDNTDLVISKKGFRMYVAELAYYKKQFDVHSIEKLSIFDGNDRDQREKNWVPFVSNDTLLLGYSITPHKIFKPYLSGTEFCQSISSSNCQIAWQWGEPRGGTPAMRYGDQYLAFFHSSIVMESVHYHKPARHYFIGCYTFGAQFPFPLTRMSPFPIIGKDFYHGPMYKPYWGSIVAVFPCGFIDKGDYFLLFYGRQDRELWVAKIDKKGLFNSLVPV